MLEDRMLCSSWKDKKKFLLIHKKVQKANLFNILSPTLINRDYSIICLKKKAFPKQGPVFMPSGLPFYNRTIASIVFQGFFIFLWRKYSLNVNDTDKSRSDLLTFINWNEHVIVFQVNFIEYPWEINMFL